MIIWKPLVGKRLQCVKELTNEVNKNVVAVVLTNSHCKTETEMCNRNLHPCATEICIVVFMFLFLPHCDLDISATEKRINHHGSGYGVEIPEFSFLRT